MASTLNHDGDEAAFVYAMHLSSPALPMTLKAAIELNLLEIITHANPNTFLSPHEIATHLPTTNPDAPAMLDRILRLLASHNILTSSVSTDTEGHITRRYGPAPVCEFLTKNKDGASVAKFFLMLHYKANIESFYYLKDAVLEGGLPFEMAHKKTSFEYLKADSRAGAVFHEGMMSHSTIIMRKIMEKYRGFDEVRVLVDVGGGIGASLNMVVSMNPHIKGINLDLPFVIAEAPGYPGIEHVGGDMFSSVPRGDAILMKWILHNWDDEHCVKVLKNCWKALPENGKVIIVESILTVAPESTLTAQVTSQFDLAMLTSFHGAKERTEKEFQALAMEAGFYGFKALFAYYGVWLIEISK